MASGELRERLEARSDDELLDILARKDTTEWQIGVFPIVEAILRERGIPVRQTLAHARESECTSSNDGFAVIATFATVVESEACRAALSAADFDVVAGDQFVLQVDPALGPALGGCRLAVPQSQAEDARAFLAAADGGELSAGLLACSTCGSQDVAVERSVSKGGTFMNTFLVGPVVRDVTITYKCRACRTTWE